MNLTFDERLFLDESRRRHRDLERRWDLVRRAREAVVRSATLSQFSGDEETRLSRAAGGRI